MERRIISRVRNRSHPSQPSDDIASELSGAIPEDTDVRCKRDKIRDGLQDIKGHGPLSDGGDGPRHRMRFPLDQGRRPADQRCPSEPAHVPGYGVQGTDQRLRDGRRIGQKPEEISARGMAPAVEAKADGRRSGEEPAVLSGMGWAAHIPIIAGTT